MYLATEDRAIHMARSNYARIVPALSAHHFTGQQFSLANSHSMHSSFRSVHIHYHSWIIRSEASWRRSSWQSDCYSAGSRSWAAESLLHNELKCWRNQQRQQLLLHWSNNQWPKKKKKKGTRARDKVNSIFSAFLKNVLTQRISETAQWKGFLLVSPLCCGCWRQQQRSCVLFYLNKRPFVFYTSSAAKVTSILGGPLGCITSSGTVSLCV